MLSRLVIALLPRSKCLLISWLKSPSAVILEPRKIKSATVSTVLPSICHEVMGTDAMILVFWMLSFKPTFSLSSRGSLILHFLPQGWCHLHIWGYWYFSWQSWFQLVLHPAQSFSWCTLSAYELNKWGDNIQPWCNPFPIWNQSVVPCPVLTVASWPAYRFLKKQVRWSCMHIFFFSEFSTVYCDPHTQRLWHSQWSRNRCFSGTLLLFWSSNGCWQFDFWFLCLL